MSDYQTIKVDIDDGIMTLTLHRPEKMNAFTSEMMQEMIHAFDRADADDAVRAVIVASDVAQADASAVNTWTDRIQNAAMVSTSATPPTYRTNGIGGLPSVQFARGGGRV